MRRGDIESRGEKSNSSYAGEDGDRNWVSCLVPTFVAVNVILFFVEMYLNNYLRQVKHRDYSFGDGEDKCVGRFLGRFSFQPLGEISCSDLLLPRLYMVAVDRQLKNREQMMAAEANAAKSGAHGE